MTKLTDLMTKLTDLMTKLTDLMTKLTIVNYRSSFTNLSEDINHRKNHRKHGKHGRKEMSGAFLLVTTPRTPGDIGLVPLEPIGIPPFWKHLKQQYGAKTNLKLNKKEWKKMKIVTARTSYRES